MLLIAYTSISDQVGTTNLKNRGRT